VQTKREELPRFATPAHSIGLRKWSRRANQRVGASQLRCDARSWRPGPRMLAQSWKAHQQAGMFRSGCVSNLRKRQALQAVIAAGGSPVGNIATTEVDGVGMLRVVYARDPEGNIVELQKWS